MIKIQIKYQSEEERRRVLKIISAGTEIKRISEPHKSGEFYRVYVEIL